MAALGWRFGRDGVDGDRRPFSHRVAEVAQRLGEARGAEGARPHVGAAPAGAGLDRGRDENAGLGRSHRVASSAPIANQDSGTAWRNEWSILAK